MVLPSADESGAKRTKGARGRAESIPDSTENRRVTPQLDAERSEIREWLRVALAELPERQRFVVQMVDVEGAETAYVAAIFVVAVATALMFVHTHGVGQAGAAWHSLMASTEQEGTGDERENLFAANIGAVSERDFIVSLWEEGP